jgi:hypothetical protein
VPPLSTVIKLDFIKPFPNRAQSDFVLAPVGGGTQLTWSMSGAQKLFPSKVMSVFITMDKMIGGDFERGLAALKAAAER